MRIADWARAIAADERLPGPPEFGGSRIWSSLPHEARPFLIAGLWHRAPFSGLVVTTTNDRVLEWQAKLVACGLPESAVCSLPGGLSGLFEDAAPEATALSDRIGALRLLADGTPGIAVADVTAALERTLPLDVLAEVCSSVEVGMQREPDDVQRALVSIGYELADPVRLPGQFSRRGGVLDVFAMGEERPTRIEFFGDAVESMRYFDPNTQRSTTPAPVLVLAPSRETLPAVDGQGVGALVRHAMEVEADHLPAEAAAHLRELVSGDAHALEQGIVFDRIDLYRPWLHPDGPSVLGVLPESGLVVLDDPLELQERAERAESELRQALEARAQRGDMLHAATVDFLVAAESLHDENALSFTGTSEGAVLNWDASSLARHAAEPNALGRALAAWRKQGRTIVVATDQPARSRAVLAQVEVHPTEECALSSGAFLAQGNLAGGFELATLGLVVLTDKELFGVGRLRLPQRRFNEGVPVADVLDLEPGDYVVHINFGIGVYRGLVQRTVAGVEKEYLFVEYATPDKLYVPADQLDRIQKYLSAGDAPPKINRLRGGDWQRTISKAREDAREFARDLIALYAERKRATRPAYPSDAPWQHDMESTFPWVETPAQLAAIGDVKLDLQGPYPMDRLICGDVGFGKTEVAIRAAFKVAAAGRQVVVLCPTTILSEQHYRSFHERLSPFSVRLDYLNRFRSAADRREIVARLAAGDIDVLIGTHALLNKDLKFKDLGLVIVDEEQKFGVKHKEALKKLRASVDFLSMSATPIPRTLSMALMDIRQMSLINDPPPGRLPIRTVVRPYSSEVVTEALLRELRRGGQVYYVFNRVQGIHHVAERVRQLVPSARVAVAHGQMSEEEIEPVMLAFIGGEVDILVSTTIVENGLDIPNANTLIVENADRFGLAQLYQLRGRVGRSDRQAYAYLLYEGSRALTDAAGERLEALQEFAGLGSGYSLAFRDLQIRGAGELLGAKQSGTMATVGYELFTQLIQEEVAFLRSYADGETPAGYRDPLEGLCPLPSVDLPVQALLPDTYIEDQSQRLYFYREMMSARSPEALAEVRTTIVDRYGREPATVERAFRVMRCRMLAADLGFESLDGNGGRIAATIADTEGFAPRVVSLVKARNRECYIARGQFIWPFTGDSLLAAERFLDTIQDAREEVDRDRASSRV